MARTPDPDGTDHTTRPRGRGGLSLVPIAVVVGALILAAVLYISLRSQPNYQEEGDLGDQPAPVETST